MYSLDRRKIYEKAMEAWGFEAQCRMLQEECAELVVAVSHYFRKRPDGMENLIEELADVYIMVGQISEYLDPDLIEHIVNNKLRRVEKKLDKETSDGD